MKWKFTLTDTIKIFFKLEVYVELFILYKFVQEEWTMQSKSQSFFCFQIPEY